MSDWITLALAAVARWLSSCLDTLRQAYAADEYKQSRRDLAD